MVMTRSLSNPNTKSFLFGIGIKVRHCFHTIDLKWIQYAKAKEKVSRPDDPYYHYEFQNY